MTYRENDSHPDIQAIDLKACTDLSDISTKAKVTNSFPFPGGSHEKWKSFCEINGLSFRFIYLTTHEGNSSYADGVLVIRRSVASKFFGSMWETYLATNAVDEYYTALEKDSEGVSLNRYV